MKTSSINNISYTLKKSGRAKKLRLAVYCDGSVVLTAPHWVGAGLIEKFVMEKSEWIMERLEAFKPFKKLSPRFNKRHYEENKEKARELVLERLAFFNAMLGLKYNRVSIKNQKTKWGSCSKNRNLNFNYRILFLSEKARDYIIIHELCHLKEMNHSRRFWAHVERIMPEYKEVKNELRVIR